MMSASISRASGMLVRVIDHASSSVMGITTSMRATANQSDVSAADHASRSDHASWNAASEMLLAVPGAAFSSAPYSSATTGERIRNASTSAMAPTTSIPALGGPKGSAANLGKVDRRVDRV